MYSNCKNYIFIICASFKKKCLHIIYNILKLFPHICNAIKVIYGVIILSREKVDNIVLFQN